MRKEKGRTVQLERVVPTGLLARPRREHFQITGEYGETLGRMTGEPQKDRFEALGHLPLSQPASNGKGEIFLSKEREEVFTGSSLHSEKKELAPPCYQHEVISKTALTETGGTLRRETTARVEAVQDEQ